MFKIKKMKRKILFFSIFFQLVFPLGNYLFAQKASLYFFPSTGSFFVDEIFPVEVRVNSGGVLINAADGIIVFDPQKLEVVKITTEKSVFNLWVQKPTFSNQQGIINFSGGVLPPSFNGPAGNIFTVHFKAKNGGQTNLTISQASVLADDGKGTNVLGNVGGASFNILVKEIPTILPPQLNLPPLPKIFSPTHPDEKKWYSSNSPKFTFNLPKDTTAISYELDKNPNTRPEKIVSELTSSISFTGLEDGIWYFHLRFKNENGWGPVAHYKVQIDTTPPFPFEPEILKENPYDPRPILIFKAKDETSGIDFYQLKIGEGEWFLVEELEEYQLPFQAPGKHQILVKAVDKAGNERIGSTFLEVLPLPSPSLIASCPKRLNPCSNLKLEGRAKEATKLNIYLYSIDKKEENFFQAKVDAEGNWQFFLPPLGEGKYKIFLESENQKGAKSEKILSCEFEVNLSNFIKFGKIAIDYLSIMTTLVILTTTVILALGFLVFKIFTWKKELKRETKELNQAILAAFKALRDEVQEQIEYLDGKPGLTISEAKVRDKLKEALDIAEKFIGKEIEDIEKKIE